MVDGAIIDEERTGWFVNAATAIAPNITYLSSSCLLQDKTANEKCVTKIVACAKRQNIRQNFNKRVVCMLARTNLAGLVLHTPAPVQLKNPTRCCLLAVPETICLPCMYDMRVCRIVVWCMHQRERVKIDFVSYSYTKIGVCFAFTCGEFARRCFARLPPCHFARSQCFVASVYKTSALCAPGEEARGLARHRVLHIETQLNKRATGHENILGAYRDTRSNSEEAAELSETLRIEHPRCPQASSPAPSLPPFNSPLPFCSSPLQRRVPCIHGSFTAAGTQQQRTRPIMPPIRADHGLSWRKAAAAGGGGGGGAAAAEEERERAKQPRRGAPVTKRSSPSHSRTPSPNLQAPASSTIATVHATTAYGHVGARRKVSSPSSKTFENGGGPRNRSHAHPQRPPFKVAGASWGVSSPTPGASGSGRAASSPTRPSGSGSGRGHSSPTLASRDAAGVDGLQLPAAAGATATSGAGGMMPSSSSAMLMPPAVPSGGGAGGSGSASLSASRAEAREMTVLDRVFLEQPHEGRQDVEGDDLHVSNEIQRHLKTRVQSQQSQLMEAMESSSSSAALLQQQQPQQQQQQQPQQAQQPASLSSVPAVVCGGGGGADFIDHHGPDLLLSSTGVTPVSPSSGSGPVQGKDDMDAMDFLLNGSSGRGGGTCSISSREPPSPPSRGGPRSRSPSGPPPPAGSQGGADVQMSEAGGGAGAGAGGDGHLREVVSGLDAMDLDDLDDVESALAVLNAKKQQLIAKKQQAQHHQHHQHPVAVVPPPPQSSNGGSSRAGGGGGGSSRQRRSGGRTTGGSSRHGGGESSPSTVGGRSEAFGVSGGGSVRGGGGGTSMSSSVSYSSGRGSRGQQGRPPPVPGHLSASTAAMRRSSPGSIASLAELDSYLEHHHRRLVEQVCCC